MSCCPTPEDLLFDNLASPLLSLCGDNRIQCLVVERLNLKEAELVSNGQTPAQGIRGNLTTVSGKAVRFWVWSCPSGTGCSFEGAGVEQSYHPADLYLDPKERLRTFLYRMQEALEA